MSQIFGPVPSRRLGFSLGIDVIPYKTCSFDCVYCQLGKTTRKTVERREYVSQKVVLNEVEQVLKQGRKIDYITFSGSGEPTLNSQIGQMIHEIKKMTSLPVAVLTNGSLLFQAKLREELYQADLVIPSLDAASQEVLLKVNRPHFSLKIDEIIRGIKEFCRKFTGEVWLEIMLVEGINDTEEEIEKLASTLSEIDLDRVQLNTVIRPPAEEFARPVNLARLKEVKNIFGKKCEIIVEVERTHQKSFKKDISEAIQTMIKRRPVTLEDLCQSLGLHRNEVIKYVESLEKQGGIRSKLHSQKRYYYYGK